MLRPDWYGAMLLASLVGCAPIRPSGVGVAAGEAAHADAANAVPAEAALAAPTAAQDPAQEEFEARVLPILHDRCSPCHFEGGKMYDRLPFDRPGTIRVLGTDLFTRIRDEEERQAIRDFLGTGAAAPESTAPPR